MSSLNNVPTIMCLVIVPSNCPFSLSFEQEFSSVNSWNSVLNPVVFGAQYILISYPPLSVLLIELETSFFLLMKVEF